MHAVHLHEYHGPVRRQQLPHARKDVEFPAVDVDLDEPRRGRHAAGDDRIERHPPVAVVTDAGKRGHDVDRRHPGIQRGILRQPPPEVRIRLERDDRSGAASRARRSVESPSAAPTSNTVLPGVTHRA